MVVISRQYLSGADKAVQIRRSVFGDTGAQPELRQNKIEIALSKYPIFLLHAPPE